MQPPLTGSHYHIAYWTIALAATGISSADYVPTKE
jgi:hypothetical protein